MLCQEVEQLVCETAVFRSAARNMKMAKGYLFTCSANQDNRVQDFFASLLLSNSLFSLNLWSPIILSRALTLGVVSFGTRWSTDPTEIQWYQNWFDLPPALVVLSFCSLLGAYWCKKSVAKTCAVAMSLLVVDVLLAFFSCSLKQRQFSCPHAVIHHSPTIPALTRLRFLLTWLLMHVEMKSLL